MDTATAVTALGALAQETRLAIFRHLVVQGAVGVPAGDLAKKLGVAPPTLTFHLNQLAGAGLVSARRSGRQIFYALEVETMRGLMAFLAEDCCEGNPDLCAPVAAVAPCCPPRRTARPRQKA